MNKDVKAMLQGMLGLTVIITLLFIAAVNFTTRRSPAESLPAVVVDDHYDGFDVIATWFENPVAIQITTSNPGEYVKALQYAMKLAEKKTGKKIVEIKCNGIPAIYHFYLQEPKSGK